MKKIYLIFVLIFVLTLTACSDKPKGDFSLSQKELTLELGSIEELPLEMDNISLSLVEIKNYDSNIITVQDSYIIANNIGETTINITSSLLPDKELNLVVKVIQIKPLFSIEDPTVEIEQKIMIRLSNFNINDFNITLDNPNVGSLDRNYFIPSNKGVASITVINKTDPTITNTLTINVIEKKPIIQATAPSFMIGDKVQLYLEDFNGYDASDYNWSIDKTNVASLDNLVVTGKANGKVVVTASLKTDERVSATYTITIGVPSTTLSNLGEPLSETLILTGFNETATVQAGELLEFTIPGSNKLINYKWSSSDRTVVQVADEGKIYGVKEGQAIVSISLIEDMSINTEIIVNVIGDASHIDYRTRIVEAATSQEGVAATYNQDNRYGRWYPYNNADWCAIFVTWAAAQAGVSTDVILKFSYVTTGWEWFEENATVHLKDSDYVPISGDIIFFKSDGRLSHVGIVLGLSDDGNSVITMEGNTTNDLGYYGNGHANIKTRSLSGTYVYGYAVPNYNG